MKQLIFTTRNRRTKEAVALLDQGKKLGLNKGDT